MISSPKTELETKKIKHLLVVAPSFPKDEENDIVVPPLHLYVRQLRLNYPELKISVVTLHYPFHHTNYRLYNIDVYPCGGANGSLFYRPFIWHRLSKKVKAIYTKEPFDLIHSFWLNESGFIAQALSKKYRVPHVCTMMGQDALPSNRYLRFINVSKINLVALSEFQKNVLQKHKKTNTVHVIPWGIADFDIPKETSSNRPIDLICVSSLIPLKQIHLFIELVAKLKSDFPAITGHIVGGGELETELRNMISEMNLEENITLHGLLERQKTLALMEQSKALIHTSNYEAQGYVINEALAKGCEVFALSSGFVSTSKKLHLIESAEKLEPAVHNYLVSENKNIEPNIPLTMAESAKKYEALLSEIGFSFSVK